MTDTEAAENEIPEHFDFTRHADDERVNQAWSDVQAELDKTLVIAFLGTASSGKTSGIKALFDIDMGDISPIPGSTKNVKYKAIKERVSVADAPGFRDINQDVSAKAHEILQDVDVFIYVLNSEGGFKQPEKNDYEACRAFGRPVLVVMNKVDLLRPDDVDEFLRDQCEKLGVPQKDFVAVAFDPHPAIASEPQNLVAVENWLTDTLRQHGKGLLLAKALREKGRACGRLIKRATASAAAIGATPIPGSDYVPLTAVQMRLIASIAAVYDHELSKTDAIAFLTDVVLSQAGRQIFRVAITALKASGWIPGGQAVEVAAVALGSAIAASVTYGVGKAAQAYYKSGMTMSVPDLQDIFQAAYELRRQES